MGDRQLMFVPGYNPATDDLYTYSGNSGYPTGFNSGHALFPYREQLRWIGVRQRQIASGPDAYDASSPVEFPPPSVPPMTPPAQLPNYFTQRYPTLTFLAERLAVGAMHFWDGNLTSRNRPGTVAGIWALAQLRWLGPGDTLVTNIANADFRGTWNTLGGVFYAKNDCGLAEYEGANPASGSFMPILRMDTAHTTIPGWLIERQGRAVPVTMIPPARYVEMTGNNPGNPAGSGGQASFTLPAGTELATGDSGNVLVSVVNGVVHYVGHIFSAVIDGLQPTMGLANFPNVAGLTALGSGRTLVTASRRLTGAFASQTTAQSIADDLQAILDGLT